MDEDDESAAVLGQDVVLREKDVLKELLKVLPHKAQLGYSGLKEKFITSGDKTLKKIIAAAKTNDSLKVEYTCLDTTSKTIVLGCSLGIVFLYDRGTKKLSRFICERKQIPIVSIKLFEERKFIATGQFSGAITIFQYAEEKNGLMKAVLKCTVESHHVAPVTNILWTPDSMKLFTADSEGNVAITVLNLVEGKTHTVFICKEDSPVTQLSFSHMALLVSTLKRSSIWPFNTKKIVQVGMQERKAFGNFGACFLPEAGPLPTDSHVDVYAARPGLRLWKVNSEGKVLSTMIFKESIVKGEPIIETIDLPSQLELPPQSEQKQFGSLIVFNNQFLVSWQGSCVWVIDPNTGYVIGCHNNLGCVVDVSANDNELFILSKGEKHFIRKVDFETIVPCIVVEDLDLNNPHEIAKAQGASSVSEFQDQDILDKHIDEVMSRMKKGFSDVKSRVKGIKEQIRSREASEDDNSSPRATYRNQNNVECVLSGEAYSTSELDGTTSDENVNSDNASRPFESSNELLNSCELSPERKSENIEVEITHRTREKEALFSHLSKEAFPDKIVFEGTSIGTAPKKKKKVKKKKTVKMEPLNDTNNQPALETPLKDDDSVTLCDFDNTPDEPMETNRFQPINPILDKEISFDDGFNTTDYGNEETVSLDTKHASTLNNTDITHVEDKIEIQSELSHNNQSNTNQFLETVNDKILSNCHSGEALEQSVLPKENGLVHGESNVDSQQTIESYSDCSKRNILNDKNINLLITNDEIITPNSTPEFYYSLEKLEPDMAVSKNDVAKCLSNLELQPELDESNGDNESYKSDDETTEQGSSASLVDIEGIKSSSDILNKTLPSEVMATTVFPELSNTCTRTNECPTLRSELESTGTDKIILDNSENHVVSPQVNLAYDNNINVQDKSSTESTNYVNPVEDDMNIVHVKISHQRQGSNASVQSLGVAERCKEVRGEALERTHRRQPSGPIMLGADDTLEANIHQYDDENISVNVHVDDEEVEGKLYPISPFPAPQVLHSNSIYSQRRVSLSEFSLSNFDDKTEEEKLHAAIGEYDSIDVQADLIESIESMTDVEDNLSTSPLDSSGSEMKRTPGANGVKRRKRPKNRLSFPNSPCGSDMEGRPLHSPKAVAESLQERLRYLADSWADVNLPSCGQIQYIACSDSVVWAIDNHDHIFCSGTFSQSYNWKKQDGKAMLVACNQRGTVVWCIDRNKVAYYRAGIKDQNQQGSNWEPFDKNVHHVAIDYNCVWVIRTNGDVFVRTGVSLEKPYGVGWITVKVASDLVQITCLDGLVWALDVYNHVQIFQGDADNMNSSEADQASQWCELAGITASHLILGTKGVCWIIDGEFGVWFNQDVTKENPLGGTWYQLSLGEHHSQDANWFSSMLSYFTQGNEPKMIVANEIAGVLILGKQGFIHVAHGHLLGTRWETLIPSSVKSPAFWTCVSAGGMDMNKDYIWALQPNGQLYCFKPGGQSYNIQPPNKVVLKYCSAGPRSLWVLTAGPDVYVRIGISDTCPQGLKWLKVDMLAQGNRRLTSICCGNHVVWAVDVQGNAWFQMGREERQGGGFAPAWVAVEGCPLDGSKFIKIAVGPNDHIVWACDDKNNVYARKDITENFWVGTSWEVVSGTSGKDLSISGNHVWGLCPNGDVMCRFGVSSSNVMGDYWKKVPGSFDKLSVSANDDICGIDRQGHLYQRQTLLFYGSTLSSKAPSYNDLFSGHDDWEFI